MYKGIGHFFPETKDLFCLVFVHVHEFDGHFGLQLPSANMVLGPGLVFLGQGETLNEFVTGFSKLRVC